MIEIHEIDGKPIKDYAELPFGEFKKLIRKYDPLWGYSSGELKKYKVTIEHREEVTESKVRQYEVCVEATSEEAAKAIINNSGGIYSIDSEFEMSLLKELSDYDDEEDSIEILSVEEK